MILVKHIRENNIGNDKMKCERNDANAEDAIEENTKENIQKRIY